MADGFEMLEADHRRVDGLFENYLHDNDEVIARDICVALTLHTEIEEAALYPALRRYVDGGDDLADEAVAEHAAIKTLIARVYDSPPPSLLDLMTEMRRDVQAHVQSEESELFPSMQEARVDAQELGAALERARAEAEARGVERASGA
jgi:hemerythrin superfamily protein